MQKPEHEKLVVYEKALDAAVALERVAACLPGSRGDLRDQLRRAAVSVPLNIAEGAGEFSRPEKSRFYRIARRSASECLAILDIIDRMELAQPDVRIRRQLVEISAMPTAMVMRE